MSTTENTPDAPTRPGPPQHDRWPLRRWAWVTLATLAAVTASSWPLLNVSVWFDEGFTDTLIRFSFADITRYTAVDVHPPLYYWTLKAWSLVFGDSVPALRMLSVVFASLAIVFAARLAARLFSRRAAVATGVALLLSPVVLRYAHEMRMYAMVAMLAFAATLMLLRAMQTGRRRDWACYALLVAAGMWTHYFMALVWLSHWVWRAAAVHRPGQGLRRWLGAFFTRGWVIAHLLAVALFAPWVPSVLAQMRQVRKGGFWIPGVDWTTLPGFVSDTLSYHEFGELTLAGGALVFAVALACIVLAVRSWRRSDDRMRRGWMLLCCLAAVPPVLLLLISLPPLTSSFISRYLVPSSLALTMIAAIAATWPERDRGWHILRAFTGCALAAVLVLGMAAEYRLGDFNKNEQASSDSQGLISQIRERSGADTAIVTDTATFYYEASAYQTADSPVLYIPPTTYKWSSLAMLQDAALGRADGLVQLAREHGSVWVITQLQQSTPGEGFEGLTEASRFTMTDPVTGRDLYLAVEYTAVD